jgi:hypothetical protein
LGPAVVESNDEPPVGRSQLDADQRGVVQYTGTPSAVQNSYRPVLPLATSWRGSVVTPAISVFGRPG